MSETRIEPQDVERWKRELVAAGWEERRPTLWKSPKGTLHLGPAGAWKEMRRHEAAKERRNR